MAKNLIDEEIELIAEERCKEIMNGDFNRLLRKVNIQMRDEAERLYDKLIEKYYRYKTISYIRHWEGRPGTRQGQNLYGGKKIIMNNNHNPYLIVDPKLFGEEGVAGGYQHDEPYDVVQQVLDGIRGVHRSEPPFFWEQKWNAEYHSMLFEYQRGTMRNAFRKFNYRFDDIAEGLFYKEWDKLYN